MFTDFQINKATFLAVQQAIASHTVVILMNKRRSIGTGTLLSVGSKKIILTANHNIEKSLLPDLRFGFKHEGNIREAATVNGMLAEVPKLSADPSYTLRFDGEAVRDEKHDIAALALDPQEKTRGIARCYGASRLKPVEIPDGKSVLILGFPVDFSATTGPQTKMVGVTPDHLKYDSTLNERKFLPSSYDPENEFLLEYPWIRDGLRPPGYSGAGAWCVLEQSDKAAIWTPEPFLVGVITGYLKQQQLLVVAGLRPISELLSRVSRRN